MPVNRTRQQLRVGYPCRFDPRPPATGSVRLPAIELISLSTQSRRDIIIEGVVPGVPEAGEVETELTMGK
jgi:hypothetical protein